VKNKERAERARDLGNTFLLLHEASEGTEVHMMSVNSGYKYDPDKINNLCGTVACHAGWFHFSHKDVYTYTDYTESAQEMAEYLGFEKRRLIRDYMKSNSSLWGNEKGEFMFSSSKAFGLPKSTPVSLETIGTHWLGVADRWEAMV